MMHLLDRILAWFSPAAFPRRRRLHSQHLERIVELDIYWPKGVPKELHTVPCFLFNDGQDLPRMAFAKLVKTLWADTGVPAFVTIGIHAGDRMGEYGTAGQADYAGRGQRAGAYARFIKQELLPWLQRHYGVAQDRRYTYLAGFSLGGLSAFDLVWQNPNLFSVVGVFSGALWWRSTPFEPSRPDADRIAHTRVRQGPHRPGLRFWFQTGTEDETNDRNNNGIIDSIDDTLDLIKELHKMGYSDSAIAYLEIPNGRHEPTTWGQAMPHFLRWAMQVHPASKSMR